MNKKFFQRFVCFTATTMLLTSVVIGCGSSGGQQEASTANSSSVSSEASSSSQASSSENQPPLEYSVFYDSGQPGPADKAANNPNDVVTPYIEKKFNIKVKEFRVIQSGQSVKDVFAMYQAAGNLPDIMATNQQNCKYLISTSQFADLTEYTKDMKNYMSYINPALWPRWETDGKHSILPCIMFDKNSAQFSSNPYAYGNSGWSMWAREDIMAKAGYKFTPLAELAKTTTDVGVIPTVDQLKIEPAIDTPEKFADFLKKVKALNLKIGGKSVTPFSSSSWSVFHMSAMYDNGHWRIDDKGNVAGWLGTPDAKSFYKLWSQMYNGGLIDKDYLTQKEDQLQQKIASGLVACGLYVPDFNSAEKSNLQRDPAAEMRRIPWPKENQNYGYFDLFENGYNGIVINKDTKDIKRLTQYFDWLYSDEGFDILTWGPESAGLWEMKDGKKQFKADVVNDILNNNKDGKNAMYYGIYDPNGTNSYPNRAALSAPTPAVNGGEANPKDYRLNYPIKLTMSDIVPKVFGKNYNCSVDYKGITSYGDGAANTTALSNWYWSKFQGQTIAQLLKAKTDAEFDKNWDSIWQDVLKNGKYNEAQADMVKWFQQYGSKK